MRKLIMRSLLHRLMCLAGAMVASTATWAQDRPLVVAVNYPLSYFAERLLEGAADVVFPVPEGVDPSFWRPSIADISTIQSADLILLNGAGFASWIDRVSLSRAKVVNTSSAVSDLFIKTETITHSHGDGGEHSHEGIATYLWLDPSLAMAQAEAIAAAATRRGLVSETEVAPRLEALRSDWEALDAHAQTIAANAGEVVFIATHPRYQYLAEAYGLTIHSLEWEAGEAPDVGALADLKTLVAEKGARILLWEAEPPAEASAATAELGLSNVTFTPLAQVPGQGDLLSVFTDGWTAIGEAVSVAETN